MIDPKESNRLKMLVLSRKSQQSLIVGDPHNEHVVKITVLGIIGNRVKLGIEVASNIPVYRTEVWERDQKSAIEDPPKSEPAAQADLSITLFKD